MGCCHEQEFANQLFIQATLSDSQADDNNRSDTGFYLESKVFLHVVKYFGHSSESAYSDIHHLLIGNIEGYIVGPIFWFANKNYSIIS